MQQKSLNFVIKFKEAAFFKDLGGLAIILSFINCSEY